MPSTLVGREACELLSFSPMEHDAFAGEAVIDLRVPAKLASRYRGRVVDASPRHAALELAFQPVLFRTGVVESCPADLTVVVGSLVTRIRGTIRMEGGTSSRVARFDFDSPILSRDLELLRWHRVPDEAGSTGGDEDEAPESTVFFAS
jgi:hypothetical protein